MVAVNFGCKCRPASLCNLRLGQLAELTHDLLISSVHNGRQTVDIIVMDFSKAFDKVSLNKLISSLHEYGIDSTTLEWIRSFLSGRTQSVVVDGLSLIVSR